MSENKCRNHRWLIGECSGIDVCQECGLHRTYDHIHDVWVTFRHD